jgi:hypothetical protein
MLIPQPCVFPPIATAPVLYLGGTRFESETGRAWYLSWQIYVALKEVIDICQLCHMFLKCKKIRLWWWHECMGSYKLMKEKVNNRGVNSVFYDRKWELQITVFELVRSGGLLADNYRVPVHLLEAYISLLFSHLAIRLAATKVLHMKQHCVLVERWLG